MNTQHINPIVIRCKNCGGDQSYDIVRRQYVCAHCGTETSLQDKNVEYRNWRSLRHDAVMQEAGKVKQFRCPSCGAQTIVASDDASAECPFCQSTMIDSDFAGNDLPEAIIPFKISEEEAKRKLAQWLEGRKDKAANAIKDKMDKLTGCYLPYHIVRGAFVGDMVVSLQDESKSYYPLRAFLSHTAVNASNDLDNMFLDGVEPFDFGEARTFDFGYLNHQKAKVPNVSEGQLLQRVTEETQNEVYDDLKRKMHNKEISVLLEDEGNESVKALLPVYLVKCSDKIAAAVNGQTGKVAILTGKDKNLTGRWWLFPLIATIVIALVGYFIADMEVAMGFGMVFGIVFFVVAHNRHQDNFVKEVVTSGGSFKKHNDTRTVFFNDFGNGEVPTKLRFVTLGRILKILAVTLAVIFLPVLIAAPIQLMRGLPLSSIKIGYGAAWYCVPGFMAIVGAGGLAKAMMFGFPIYEEILPNGKTKRRKMKSSTKVPMPKFLDNFQVLFADKKSGCLTIGIILFLLIGSVAAMIS